MRLMIILISFFEMEDFKRNFKMDITDKISAENALIP